MSRAVVNGSGRPPFRMQSATDLLPVEVSLSSEHTMNNNAILLTGTITPRNAIFTKLTDPGIREQQYRDAIQFYLAHCTLPIVFVENSASAGGLREHFAHEVESHRLEILSFDGPSLSLSHGKGFGELEIIAHALEHSLILKNSTHVFKITGRYKVLNFDSFLRAPCVMDADLVVDLKENLSYSDSRFFYVKVSFFEEFFWKHTSLLDEAKGIYLEHVLAKATLHAILAGWKYSPSPAFPVYAGVYATENKKFRTDIFYRLPRAIMYRLKYFLIQKS